MSGSVSAVYLAADAGAELRAVDSALLETGHGVVADRCYERSGMISERLKDSHDWEVLNSVSIGITQDRAGQ